MQEDLENKNSNNTKPVLGSVRGNNEAIPMTRRYPNLPNKALKRDSEIARRIIIAWDLEKRCR